MFRVSIPMFKGMLTPRHTTVSTRKGVLKVSRSTSKVRLENGLKLDINDLARKGFIKRGHVTGPIGITWTHSYWGEVANGLIWADLSDPWRGHFRIKLGGLDQSIYLETQPRNYGGYQWYFVCPAKNRLVSVLWKVSGADRFCSRQTWGRQVAYTSQCVEPYERWRRAQNKIKNRVIGDLDPADWEFPPKPKWMRQRTYNEYEKRFDDLDGKMESELNRAISRLGKSLLF